MGSFPIWGQARVSCIGRRIFCHWATTEATPPTPHPIIIVQEKKKKKVWERPEEKIVRLGNGRLTDQSSSHQEDGEVSVPKRQENAVIANLVLKRNFQTFTSQCKSLIVDVQFSSSVMSNSLRPRGLQPSRLPCPSSKSQSLLKLVSVELVMSSNHLILRCPLPLLPLIFSGSTLDLPLLVFF